MVDNELEVIIRPSKIMVIDDDDISRRTICKVLGENGYIFVDYDSGRKALANISQDRPDLVLLDVVMPEMDGYEVCARLRELKSTDVLPVLMLTGLDDMQATDNAFNAGATDFITKPINWSLLAERVRYALRACKNFAELKEKQQQLEAAQKIARMGYWRLNLETGNVKVSDFAIRILQLENEKNITRENLFSQTHPDDAYHVDIQINNAIRERSNFQVEYRVLIHDSNEELIVKQQGSVVRNTDSGDQRQYLLGVVQDITEDAKKDEVIEYKTYHDKTTGLFNRYYFESSCRQYIETHQDTDTLTGIFFIRLTGLKKINESLSHAHGDRLLQQIAERLDHFDKGSHIVARFSNIVFSIMVKDIDSIDHADDLAKCFIDTLTAPYELDDHEIHITAGVGVSLFPIDSDKLDDIIKYADAASLSAIRAGLNNFKYHTAEMTKKASQRFMLETELRNALENNEMRVYYQPQLDARSLEVTGMEALVRWHHPVRGVVSPFEFIPIAEDTGLIIPIGNWVLRQSCWFTKSLHEQGYHLRVGVNLSPQQFKDPDLISVIEQSLQESGLEADLLDIEITESMAMHNVDECLSVLHSMKKLGVRISMDDFGTGYSSLNYLQQMPLDTLKVDQSFVRRIEEKDLNDFESGRSKNAAIIAAIISMAHSLGLNVVSEGVETKSQQRFLCGLGSQMLQGYLFSKPVPEDEFINYLKASLMKKVISHV